MVRCGRRCLTAVQIYGHFAVEAEHEEYFPAYVVRFFKITNATTREARCCRLERLNQRAQTRHVTQAQFTNWPDHGAPESTLEMISFVEATRQLRRQASSEACFHIHSGSAHSLPQGRSIVHCSAGVGRTGTFIAIDRSGTRLCSHD